MAQPSSDRKPASESTVASLQAAVERLFVDGQAELLGTLYHMLGNMHDARDVLQAAFVKCWQAMGSLGEVQNLRAYIYRVVTNAARDWQQDAWRNRRRPLPEEDTVASPGPLVTDAVEQREELAAVRRAIGELRPEDREVYLLRENGQLTYEEIAAELALPVGTVKTRMRQALAKLREALGGGK